MERYIQQLIEDLEEAAKDPPSQAYIEPLIFNDAPEIAELALVPFKSIEEWTGINQEVFPLITDLQGDQWQRVNEAIFKVFDSLNIQLIDAPPDIPPEILYEVLTLNWDFPVQFLPSSGMDLELCSGDPMTCPYGEFCNCDEPFDEFELPRHLYDFVPRIAQSIDAGLVCFLNPETLEMEELPRKMWKNPEEFEALSGVSAKNKPFDHEKWDDFWTIEPPEPAEVLKIMEDFIKEMDDTRFQEQLADKLIRDKPFAHFKTLVEGSEYRDYWFHFKKDQLEKYVKQTLFQLVNDVPWPEELPVFMNGFYNDDGSEIDPETVPLPGLCVICKKYMSENWEQNMFCILNRNDQRNNKNFDCGMFEIN